MKPPSTIPARTLSPGPGGGSSAGSPIKSCMNTSARTTTKTPSTCWGASARSERANMCDQDHFAQDQKEYAALGLVTRKQFGIMLGAGVAMLLPQVANAVEVIESDVNVTTPDGAADCYFVHPASGTAPGVLVWPDIFGLRPAFRQMAKRLAESGYSVLVVNPFYRLKKAPTGDQGAATPIAQVAPLMQALNETTHMTDA